MYWYVYDTKMKLLKEKQYNENIHVGCKMISVKAHNNNYRIQRQIGKVWQLFWICI